MESPTTPEEPHLQLQTPRRTATSLLARFLPGATSAHKMDSAGRRPRSPVNYAESPDSATRSPFETPPSQRVIDLEADDKDEEIEDDDDDTVIVYTTPLRGGLRDRKQNQSLKARENAYKVQKRPRPSRKKTSINHQLVGGDFTPVVSDRVAIRTEIASKTVASRNAFFLAKSNFFLPLLPQNNYVKKLIEKHALLSQAETAKLPAVQAYEEIETQPRGIRAVMKPYQLSGLSFMVYLHRNGLSGILGDEMGLGKTLQTLSLIQHLKENEPKVGTGRTQRPFLVVCPLSVLSSWMAESRKWAPGLKVIRFHGPLKERTRLKKIAVGEIDMFGNLTAQAKSKRKLKSRKTTTGKHVISLDTDSEDEDDVGVDLVVTTYECYRAEQSWFKKAFVWRYVVLDEGHTVKNHESLVSKSLQGLQAEYRLILTGTPLQNNLSELWSLLHWLYPEVFIDKTNELFDNSFNLTKGNYSANVLDAARHLLELIMLRRMKNSPGVNLNLPPKSEVLLFVPLSPMQRFWYTRMITKADQGLLDELFKGMKDKESQAMNVWSEREIELMQKETEALQILEDPTMIGSDAWKETKEILAQTIEREQIKAADTDSPRKSEWQKLMNLLMQLRKVCNHPYQIGNAEPNPYETGDHVITASGKFIVLEKLLAELVIKQKKKILIFSGFTKMLDLVEELLLLRGGDGTEFRSVRIDGATCRARRNLSIRVFNDLVSDVRVMLISTRAGGLGINLATASDVVLLDQDWNPQITLQAEARAHRIGQKNPVTVYKLVSQGTVEEQMMGRIQKKLYLSAKVTEAMEDIHTKFGSSKKVKKGRPSDADDSMPQLSTNQLMTLVRRGASAISRPEIDVTAMRSWDWQTTVLKCKDQPADIAVKKDAIPDARIDEEEEKRWLTEMERVEASVFEGKKLAKGARNNTPKDIAQAYMNHAQRRIGKNTTVMVDGFAISKESMNCGDWEAVPTFAGKDPRLAEPKREKKAAIEPQSHCQVCIDGGELHCCQICPRAYHFHCLDREFQSKAKGWQFNCPQHECYDCSQKTSDAGGMLYRCRWCEKAYCEDCLDWDKTSLIGDNLIEYELLRYPALVQAFYIQCPACTDHFVENPKDKALCDILAEGFRVEHEKRFSELEEEKVASTRAGSMTDATTVETTGVNTPIVIDDDDDSLQMLPTRKRKVKMEASRSSKNPRLSY